MEITMALLAELVQYTHDDKLNILGIFEDVRIPCVPFTMPMMFVVITAEVSEQEVGARKPIRVVLMDADDRHLQTWDPPPLCIVPYRGAGGRNLYRTPLALNAVQIDKPGTYQLSIVVAREEKLRIPLRILAGLPKSP